jgi:hypothetical protein
LVDSTGREDPAAGAELEMERRRIALTAAVAAHGPGALSVDVIETASDFYVWLSLPSKRIAAAASPAVAGVRRAKGGVKKP